MTSNRQSDAPLVASGGVETKPPLDGDPFEALESLMVVVEALCPTWPPRKTFSDKDVFKL
jgi:hypothetical protein